MDGAQFVIDDVPQFGPEGSTTHKKGTHSRLAYQLLAGSSSPRTSTNKQDALGHCIGHVRLKPSLERFVYLGSTVAVWPVPMAHVGS